MLDHIYIFRNIEIAGENFNDAVPFGTCKYIRRYKWHPERGASRFGSEFLLYALFGGTGARERETRPIAIFA